MSLAYKDLIVWQQSMDLVEEIYKLVKRLPLEEKYAISDQMRRSAVSVPSNIAEGKSRKPVKEYIHFLSIARGSVNELNTQLLICNRVGLLTEEETGKATELCEEVGGRLYNLITKLESCDAQTANHKPKT